MVEDVVTLVLNAKHEAVVCQHRMIVDHVHHLSIVHVLLGELSSDQSARLQVFQTPVVDAADDDVGDVGRTCSLLGASRHQLVPADCEAVFSGSDGQQPGRRSVPNQLWRLLIPHAHNKKNKTLLRNYSPEIRKNRNCVGAVCG